MNHDGRELQVNTNSHNFTSTYQKSSSSFSKVKEEEFADNKSEISNIVNMSTIKGYYDYRKESFSSTIQDSKVS